MTSLRGIQNGIKTDQSAVSKSLITIFLLFKMTQLRGDVVLYSRPILPTEFRKIAYILADFGKQEYCQTQDGLLQCSNSVGTDIR